jgi:hypothetical protein
MFKKELHNFETLYKFIQRTCTDEVEVNLRPTVCRPVCLGVGLLCGTYDQIFLFCLTIVGFLM